MVEHGSEADAEPLGRVRQAIGLRALIVGGFGLVIALCVVTVAVSVWMGNRMVSALDTNSNVHDRIADLSLASNVAMMKARRDEKDLFFLERDTGNGAAHSHQLARVTDNLALLRDNLVEISRLVDDVDTLRDINEIERALEAYELQLRSAVELRGRIGDEQSGERALLSVTAQRIEVVLSRRHAPGHVRAEYWHLRRLEREGIATAARADALAFDRGVTRFRLVLDGWAMPTAEKLLLMRLTDEYRDAFHEYLSVADQIQSTMSAYQDAAGSVEPRLERLYRHQLQSAEALNVKARQAQRIAEVGLFVVLLVAAALSLLVAAAVNRVVRRGVEPLIDLVTRVGQGKLGARIDTEGRHEFGRLAIALNDMASALQMRQAYLRAMMDSFPYQIWLKDTQGRFLAVNEPLVRACGQPGAHAIIGKTDSDIWPPERAQQYQAEDREVMDCIVSRQFERRTGEQGGQRWEEVFKAQVLDDDGRLLGTVGLARDITERKHAEQQVQDLTRTLERRVRERTAELEASNKELESFSYSVSHDLRAPLRTIDGWSLALMEDYGDRLDNQGLQYLRRVRVQAQYMAEVIDNLIKLARVTRSEMHRATVSLSELAAECLAELQRMEPERSVACIVRPGLKATGDAVLLSIALQNLLGNAWKFTGKAARARVEFGQETTSEGDAFYVRDNGAGFDMAYAKRLFTAFHRLHGAADFPGSGIGLATVQRIIQRHGGRIWAQAREGHGATFYFTLGECSRQDARKADVSHPEQAVPALLRDSPADGSNLGSAQSGQDAHGRGVLDAG